MSPGATVVVDVEPELAPVAPDACRSVGNRLYYPQSFLGMDREPVASVCRALGDLGSSEKLMFWLRDHGALAGKSVTAALEAGVPLAKGGTPGCCLGA